MDNTKEFKTITLRNLDENTDVVKIMNEVMNDRNIKTGQSIIEFIIKDYALKKELLLMEENDHYKTRNELTSKISQLTNELGHFKKSFRLLNNFQDSFKEISHLV